MSKVYRCCRWIVEKLKLKERLTFEEFLDLWMNDDSIKGGIDFSKRNFHRYQERLRDVFGIEIGNEDRGDYAYFFTHPEQLSHKNVGEWMLYTLAFGEKLYECRSIKDRIIVEDIPSGGIFLDVVTDGMKENKKILLKYLKYNSQDVLSTTIEPYCVHLHHQRWFVLGKLDNGKLYTFALDRMLSVTMTSKTFKMDPDFDAHDYFKDMIGIYDTGEPVEHIVLRAFDTEPYYLRDLPLHHSQREIGSGEGYTDFMIDVKPNKELIAALLYKRERVKVLSPESVVEKMKAAAQAIKDLYD